MNDVGELKQAREIEALLVDYCRYLDTMDLAALGALFSEECTVVYGPDPRLAAQGREALQASLSRMWRWERTAHHLSNVRIWFDGAASARAESAVWAWHLAPNGEEAQVFGIYHDRLEKTGGRWLIWERRMEAHGSSGAFRVPIPPAHRAPPPAGWEPPEGL